jgi:hypothetical protein
MFFVFLGLIRFDKKFLSFCVFLKFDFVLDSRLGFGLFFELNQKFRVNLVRSKLGQRLRPCLDGNVFAKGFPWLKGVFGKHPLSLFEQFWL